MWSHIKQIDSRADCKSDCIYHLKPDGILLSSNQMENRIYNLYLVDLYIIKILFLRGTTTQEYSVSLSKKGTEIKGPLQTPQTSHNANEGYKDIFSSKMFYTKNLYCNYIIFR